MALVDLKSNLANFRSSFTTKPLEDTVNKGSELNIDSAPKVYNRRTAWTNAKVERSELNRDADAILKYTGRTKFIPKFVATSKLNIDSVPVRYSGTTAWTKDTVAPSKFNIDSSLSKFWTGDPDSATQQRKAPSKYKSEKTIPFTSDRWVGKTPPAANGIDDKRSGATGFVVGAVNKNNTAFIGANVAAGTYDYPTSVIGVHGSSVVSLPLTNTKYPIDGISTMQTQLGNGSKFYYIENKDARQSVTFSQEGYNNSKKYGSVVTKSNSILKKLTEANGYTVLSEQYKKLNLRDDTKNIYDTYINQPYVLRGIQREDKKEPQLWGIGRFDDGLIRGGITAAVERSALDTVRIAKWLASPKGILWVVKQVGLGLTNPKVETITDSALDRQTRIHTGVASLLSVPGSAFGLHFTRHGIPFANEAASYGNVQIAKTLLYRANKKSNRLVSLQDNLFSSSTVTLNFLQSIGNLTSVSQKAIIQTAKGFKGGEIEELSGILGPQSVYGVGSTPIRRVVDTVTDAVNNAKNAQFATRFNDKNLYAGGIRATTNNVYDVSKDDKKNTVSKIETSDDPLSLRNRTENDYDYSDYTPGSKKDNILSQLESNTLKAKTYIDAPVNPINNYEVLAYNKIPKSKDIGKRNDFRTALSDDSKAFSGKIIKDNETKMSYANKNLEIQKGFGTQGAVGADRSNPLEFLAPSKGAGTVKGFGQSRRALAGLTTFRGDKITALDVRAVALTTDQVYPVEKDQIEFYFEDGAQGTNVMVFRCTMTGFSDSFSPSWNRIDIMGRPDGAYLYSSFERQVSFTFTAAATTKSEMIPMWRKLNYLASYTMPDFRAGGRPAGPFMRLTIGNLFKNTPGFLNSLSYTIPDEATWDVDADNRTGEAKQLPNIVEVSVGYTVIADFRPQVKGRVYSLFAETTTGTNDWLWDSGVNATTAKEDSEQYETDRAALKKKADDDAAAAVTETPAETTTTTETAAKKEPLPADPAKTEVNVTESNADITPEENPQ